MRRAHGRSRARGPAVLVLALLAVLGALSPINASSAVAVSAGLELRTAATYTLRPDEHVVHVSVEVTASNLKPDAGDVRYYYDRAPFAIQPEATHVAATTTAGAGLRTAIVARGAYSELDVLFGQRLYYPERLSFRFAYDLPAGAPRSRSEIRVGSAFAAFSAWAFGDEGDVRIVLPGDYSETVRGYRTERTSVGGQTVLTARAITDTGPWYVFVTADRPAGLRWTRLMVVLHGVPHSVVIRAWPEDPEWSTEVEAFLQRGLPALADLVGLDWPVGGDLIVTEVFTPLLEGYGGFYYEKTDTIDITEDLDPFTVLHEASHAWFNGRLLAERWADEGLADEYAARALLRLDGTTEVPEAVERSDPAAFPLLAWPEPGRIDDQQTESRERYGYEASWQVIRELVAAAGVDGMRTVLAAASNHEIAYVGAVAPETVSGESDWRRFLDLLEERAHVADASGLFQQWVVPPTTKATLDERSTARADYAALLTAGNGWLPPFAVRLPMAKWDFGAAERTIEDASQVLQRRVEIDRLAARLRVAVTDALRRAYEGAQQDLSGARSIANEELDVLHAIVAAHEATARPRDVFVVVGLLGTQPEMEVDAAERAFSAGRLDEALSAAGEAQRLLAGAVAVGTQRVASAGGATVLLGGGLTVMLLRRRRRAPAALVTAATLPSEPGGTAEPGAEEPLPGPPKPGGAAEEGPPAP